MTSKIFRPEYPRPDFERSEWLNLNGEWDFEFDDEYRGEKEKWYKFKKFSGKIIVPFCYESALSRIEDTSFHNNVWYKREVIIPDSFKGERIILNFGAVDYYAKVWINGELVGTHTGGYTPFKFDITNVLKEEKNTIVVMVEDSSTNTSQPRGKQRWKEENFGCWYTQVTGIWQTVWLEAVSETYIEKVKITPDIDTGSIKLDVFINGIVEGYVLNTVVSFKDLEVANIKTKLYKNIFSYSINIKSDHFEFKLLTWSPSDPNLYDIRFELIKDINVVDNVKSYFGMRKVSTKNGAVLINNQPVYQRLVLDQGYFDGGLLTAASDEDYVQDIEMIKKFGFNGVRMHQKVEDPRFLYWADKMGILVWGEMGSPFEFNDSMITSNTNEWRQVVERDYNHPSIIVWTLMNESWGIPNILVDKRQQYHTISLYYMVKSYDETRLVISNDGWEHTVSDIATFHDYTQDGEVLYKKICFKDKILEEPICFMGNILGTKYMFAEGYKYNGQPILFSECCGTAFNSEKGWGYGNSVQTEEDFLNRYKSIINAIYKSSYIVGFCCTQLTDVQQEINGLMTIDRKPKVDPEKFSKIIKGYMD